MTVLVKGGGILIHMAILAFGARLMEVADFGQWQKWWSYSLLASAFIGGGSAIYLTRSKKTEVEKGTKVYDRMLSELFRNRYSVLFVASALTVMVLLGTISALWAGVVLAVVISHSANRMLIGIYRSARKPITAAAVEQLIPLSISVSLLAMAMAGEFVQPQSIVFIAAVGAGYLTVVLVPLLQELFATNKADGSGGTEGKGALLKLSITALIGASAGHIDAVILGLVGSNTDVAIYRVQLALVLPISVLTTTIGGYVAPIVAERYSNRKNHAADGASALDELIGKAATLSFAISLVYGAMIFGLYSLLIENIFGEEYMHSALFALVLASGIISAMFGSIAINMNMCGLDSSVFNVSIAALISFLIFGYVFTEYYGAIGFAIASVIVNMIRNAGMTYILYSETGVVSFPRFRHVISLIDGRGLIK